MPVALLVVLIGGCITVTPVSPGVGTFDEALVREETLEVVRGAAQALSAGDEEVFLQSIDRSLKTQIAGDLDLSLPQAAELAQALNDAEAVKVHADIVFYELTIDSETFSFYVLREVGTWKLGGL